MPTARHRRDLPIRFVQPTGRTRRGALVVAGASVAAGALMLLAANGAAADSDKTGTGDPKVTICHATSSYTNPYVSEDVDAAGAWDGHEKQTGPVFSPDLPQHVSWGDIIPETTYNGVTFSLNWDAAGQAIWNNGCNLPGATPSTSAPASDTETTSAPASDPASTSAPASDPASTSAPASDTETTSAPASESDSTSAPASESDSTSAPASDTSAPASETAPASSSAAAPSIDPGGSSAAASSSGDGGVAAASASRAAHTNRASHSSAAGVAGVAAGPIPAGADAGLHAPVTGSSTSETWAWLLMIIGGLGGLFLGVRPRRSRAN